MLAWSVDRLGRSLQDLIAFLFEIHAAGVDLYLHVQGLDTSTPSGKAMFQMLGVFAEFERSLIRERVMAGLARGSQAGHQEREAHQADHGSTQTPKPLFVRRWRGTTAECARSPPTLV